MPSLRDLGAAGRRLVGHPACYRRFGFQYPQGPSVEGVPQAVFFALALDGNLLRGVVTFHEAFKAEG